MRLAIISDVHANLEALNAVVQDIEQQNIEKTFFLGDAVGYGADPNKCVKLIDNLCEIKLLGNHDYVSLGLTNAQNFNLMAQQSIFWTQRQLKTKSIEIMSRFEIEATFLDYYFVHASPTHPLEWNYLLNIPEAQTNFNDFSQSFCFVGHSHLPTIFCKKPDGDISMRGEVPFTAEPDCRYIINVGSVGQPRDGDQKGCYLIAETDDNSFEYRRVGYNLIKAQGKMKKAQLPEFLITRLAEGK